MNGDVHLTDSFGQFNFTRNQTDSHVTCAVSLEWLKCDSSWLLVSVKLIDFLKKGTTQADCRGTY